MRVGGLEAWAGGQCEGEPTRGKVGGAEGHELSLGGRYIREESGGEEQPVTYGRATLSRATSQEEVRQSGKECPRLSKSPGMVSASSNP
jgi:hypothetical protein